MTGNSRSRRAFDGDDLRDLDWLAGLMDDRFRLPGTRIRFGMDVLMGLVPVLGDTASTAISGYLIWRAARLGLPGWLLAGMAGNLAIDWLLGLVPLAGDLLDVGFRANRRNLNMIRRHLARRSAAHATIRPGADWYAAASRGAGPWPAGRRPAG